jgi:hypothetical protein
MKDGKIDFEEFNQILAYETLRLMKRFQWVAELGQRRNCAPPLTNQLYTNSDTMSESDKRVVKTAVTNEREPDWCGTITHLQIILSAMILLRGYECAKHELKSQLERITK